MPLNQVPSAAMLHSVGALMDTSFLRDAVADANGSSRPGAVQPLQAWRWVRAVVGRLGKARK